MSDRLLKRDLDKLDDLIIDIFRSAGTRGLTIDEATVLVCDWVARSDDPELQRLADADPGIPPMAQSQGAKREEETQ